MATEPVSLTNGLMEDLDAIALEAIEMVPTLERVELYLGRKELDPDGVDEQVKLGMAKHLNALPINQAEFTPQKVKDGDFDEFFALAYQESRRTRSGEDDPIDAVRTRGSATWDFVVDTFEEPASQGIIIENIRAAGALDYIHALGEKAGAYRLTDALVLRWATGRMDLPPGALQDQMYRYFKLREERMSAEERGVVYRRVLAKGNARLIDGMVLNEHHPRLWEQLLREFADYIGKVEEADDPGQVSTAGVYEATQLVQVNLSERMTGMALMQVREMYAQLNEALDILRSKDIVNAVIGGRRKNVWAVLETLAREELDVTLNTAALRTEAVQGNKLFSFVADFDRSTINPAVVRAAAESAKSYIFSQQALGQEMLEEERFDEEEQDDEDLSGAGFDDDEFEDF